MSSPSTEDSLVPQIDAADLADEVVTISRAELDELRVLARLPRPALDRQAHDDPAVVTTHATISSREEELTQELAASDRRVADLDSAYRRAVRDRELATTLAGRPLVSGAVSQLITLWREDFDVYEESGEYKVAARDGRTMAQWVGERLVGPDYAHFCLPSSRGGAVAKGLSQSRTTADSSVGARNLGEAVVTQWRESATSRAGSSQSSLGWGRRS